MVWGNTQNNDEIVENWVNRLINNDNEFKSLNILSSRNLNNIHFKSIFKALSQNHIVKELFISPTYEFEQDTIKELITLLKINNYIEVLSIGDNDFFNNKQFKEFINIGICNNKGLVKLDLTHKNIDYFEEVDNPILNLISSNLKDLNLSYNNLNDMFLENLINKDIRIESLSLNGNSFSSKGSLFLHYLLKSQKFMIKKLYYLNNEIFTESLCLIIDSLKINKSLNRLHISNKLCSKSNIVINENKHFLTILSNTLKYNQNITDLYFSNFNSLNISSNLDELSFNKSLKYLTLKKCNLNDQVFIKMIKGIFSHDSSMPLQDLDISENNITDKGLVELFKIHNLNKSFKYKLEKLNFSKNLINYENILIDLTKNNYVVFNNLNELNFSLNKFNIDGFKRLSKHLMGGLMPNLNILEMSDYQTFENINDWLFIINEINIKRSNLQIVFR